MRESGGASNRQIVVVNSSHPELDQLAGELSDRGLLRQYVGRYFPSGRKWERALESFRATRDFYLSGPGRRRLPQGLESAARVQAGTFFDFASAVPRRLMSHRGEAAYRALQEIRDKAIIRAGLRTCCPLDPVLANFSVALELFRRAQQNGALRLLNYPIAHHRFTRQLLEQEAVLHPEFASDLMGQALGGRLAERLDQEVSLASHILVGSTFVRDSFVASGVPSEKLHVENYGVDIQDFTVRRSEERRDFFRAVWVGQVSQRKGIKYLLEAWKRFGGPSTELVIAGHFMAPPSALAPYEGLYRPVGFLTITGLRQLFADSDVLVLPSLIEGMPLVILQAMAAGLPVIVSAHAAGDLVREGVDGFIVPIRSTEEIIHKLELLRQNASLRSEMSHNASRRAQEFTWLRFRRRAAEFVESLLNF